MEDPTKLGSSNSEDKTQIKTNTTADVKGGDFVAGIVLASRYRIIGLIGKGGMGEVYKAEDIKLSQTVALKFLPDSYKEDSAALERFHSEVRHARQVSHVNVCRVFDIGEIDGRHFLSMEFVDGDDLSALLKRVGRFTSERAVEIARQLCVGMEAIHTAGILHRDLKPGNIIIDSKGVARITDFGIAGIEAEMTGDNIRAGTPAYMSPEQVTGKEVTVRSDIYALGLVLYEIFTGKQAFIADNVLDLIKMQQTSTPTNPSEIVKGIDPLVESVIAQCLEKDPKNRPQSALHVAMALPGGNPMQIALDAGQTPSPEMIAATPVKGALRPWAALTLLVVFVAAFSAGLYIRSIYATNAYAPLNKPPAVLAERARTVINDLGYTETPKDTDYKFVSDWRVFENVVKKQDDPRSWIEKLRNGQPAVYLFTYRQSPEYLLTTDNNRITWNNPPFTLPGMVTVELDVTGRLVTFAAFAPIDYSTGDKSAKTDWKKLFDEAGLDITRFTPVEVKWTPPYPYDETVAWEGTMAGNADVSVSVAAAEFHGLPVYFRVRPSWMEPDSYKAFNASTADDMFSFTVNVLFFLIVLIGPIVLVRYNLKRGRGDLTGAIKIGLFCLVLYLLMAFLIIDAPPTFEGVIGYLIHQLERGLYTGAQAGLLYLAIEPFVRRQWPEILISWSRLMMGNFRDPLIGRDILIGVTFGVASYLAQFALGAIQAQLDPKAFVLMISNAEADHIQGAASALSDIFDKLRDAMFFSFGFLFLILVMTFIFRKKFLGALAAFVFFSFSVFVSFFSGKEFWAASLSTLIWVGLFTFILVRFGVVTFICYCLLSFFLVDTAFTLDLSSFYFPSTALMAGTTFALAAYAYYISLAGKKVLGDSKFFDAN